MPPLFKKIIILIPVLNEEKWILQTLKNLEQTLIHLSLKSPLEWQVVISDAGSMDQTLEIIDRWMPKKKFELLKNKIQSPSIGKTINLGLSNTQSDFVLILPCDTVVTLKGLQELEFKILHKNALCGGFRKQYKPETFALKLFQFSQNFLKIKFLHTLCWTHGIFFHRACLKDKKVPEIGFMEDILLSDHLKKNLHWTLLKTPITVSSRRYLKDGVLKRITLNLAIYTLYRTRLFSVQWLRKLYHYM